MSTTTFGDLRALLQQKPSPKLFKKVVRLLDGMQDDPMFEEVLLPYTEGVMREWDVMSRCLSSTKGSVSTNRLLKIQRIESLRAFKDVVTGALSTNPEVIIFSGYGMHAEDTPHMNTCREQYRSVRAVILHQVGRMPYQSLPQHRMFPNLEVVYHTDAPKTRNTQHRDLYYGYESASKSDITHVFKPEIIKRADGPTKAVRAYYRDVKNKKGLKLPDFDAILKELTDRTSRRPS